jgi:hypothetical protein
MTDADRSRLVAILGMLGSEHQGERDSAALQAEAFRKKHGLTWEELLALPPIEAPEPPPPQPDRPAWTPPEPAPFTSHSPIVHSWEWDRAAIMVVAYVTTMLLGFVAVLYLISSPHTYG